jgi:hypothetical protein
MKDHASGAAHSVINSRDIVVLLVDGHRRDAMGKSSSLHCDNGSGPHLSTSSTPHPTPASPVSAMMAI